MPHYTLAGFCCGLALASEFSSGLIAAALFVWLLLARHPGSLNPNLNLDLNPNPNLNTGPDPPAPAPQTTDRFLATHPSIHPSTNPPPRSHLLSSFCHLPPLWAFCLAASLPLFLIPAYTWACFGTPFTLAYSHQASFPAMKQGVYAIQWPDPVTAWNLLIPPTRGLFFWTPFLIMAGAGYWALAVKSTRLFLLTYAVPVLHVVVISGRTWDWEAGLVLGPRLLAPMLPLLALPCALGTQRWPKIGLALAAYSVGITTLATLTDATPPALYYNPLTELHLPLLVKGELSPNLGVVLGLPAFVSIGLFFTLLVAGAGWLWRRLSQPTPPHT